MTPEQVKKKIQDTYVKAFENRSMQWHHQSGIQYLFQGLKLYGRDAGTDFIETHLETIIQEAIESAGCKGTSLTIMLGESGQAAVEGIMQALRQLTALKVDARGSHITLSWAEANPGLL